MCSHRWRPLGVGPPLSADLLSDPLSRAEATLEVCSGALERDVGETAAHGALWEMLLLLLRRLRRGRQCEMWQ